MSAKARERSGVWYVLIDHRGQRKAKKIGTGAAGRKAAQHAAGQINARLALNDLSVLAPPPEAVPLFRDWAPGCLERWASLRQIRPGSLENYQHTLRIHLEPFFGRHHLDRITPELIEQFITVKRAPGGSVRFADRPLGEHTLRQALQVLRLLLRRAVKAKLISTSPMADVEVAHKRNGDTIDPFSPAELRRIVEVADKVDHDFGVMLRLWAQSGARAGEILGLRRSDLDLDRGEVTIARTFSRKRLGPPKTGESRTVSILIPTLDAISDWRPGSGTSRSILSALKGLKVQAVDPEARLFPYSASQMRHMWDRTLRRAGVRHRMSEMLRHTCASTLLSRNAPILYVQRQGGWRSAAILLKVYAKYMPQPDVALATTRKSGATRAV